MGRCRDHPRDRSGQFASQLLSGIPGLDRGRGAEETPGPHCPGSARRRRTGVAGEPDRPGRRDPPVGRQSDPCGRSCDRGAGFPGQRGQHDGRILSGRETPGVHRRGCASCRTDQHGLSRGLGSQRHGEGSGRSNRPPDGIRCHRRALAGASTRDGLRARCPAVRLPADPGDGGHRPLRADGEPASGPPGHRVAAVRSGAGGGALAGTLARHHQRHAIGGRPRDEQARGDRAAPRCHRESRQHEHSLHRQDRHADRGHHHPERGARCGEPAVGRSAAARLCQCRPRDRHREPARCGHRRGRRARRR